MPSRVIVRAAVDFLLAISAGGIRCLGSIQRSVVLNAIVVANVQHITRSAIQTWRYARVDQIPPDSERRPVSIRGLSQSLMMPFETTRRHVDALERDGLCRKSETGVVVPSDVLLSEQVIVLNDVVWQAFTVMISSLKSLDYDFGTILGEGALSSDLIVEDQFEASAVTQSPRGIVSRVVSEFYLRCAVEANAPTGDDWVMGQVWIAFMSLNSAAWSRDAEKAWRYSRADTPPPDHVRTPASIADAAKLSGLGKELVRRKAQELIAAGRLERASNGYLVSMDYMQGPKPRAGGAAIVKAFYRMIYDLTALGVQL